MDAFVCVMCWSIFCLLICVRWSMVWRPSWCIRLNNPDSYLKIMLLKRCQYFITLTFTIFNLQNSFNHIAIFRHWAGHSIHGLKILSDYELPIRKFRLTIARKSPIDCCWITKVNDVTILRSIKKNTLKLMWWYGSSDVMVVKLM